MQAYYWSVGLGLVFPYCLKDKDHFSSTIWQIFSFKKNSPYCYANQKIRIKPIITDLVKASVRPKPGCETVNINISQRHTRNLQSNQIYDSFQFRKQENEFELTQTYGDLYLA